MSRFRQILVNRIGFSAASPWVLAALLFGAVSCKKSATPDWDQPGGGSPASPSAEVGRAAPAAKPTEALRPAAARKAEKDGGLRFITYNVKNWLKMDRYVDHKLLKDAPKPAAEKAAVITLLARHRPDVVGLCEIGGAEDLAEIQQLLKAAGIDLPHSHFTGGSDPVRHLGFLSRHPITSTGKPEQSDYHLQGRMFTWNRGVLDATIQANGRPYHFLGVHLKSKREVQEGDEEEMRRAEARLLRRHADGILEKNPDERLIVYGDFNDTRSSVSGKSVVGNYSDPKYLTAIPAQDSVGTRWTHFWELNDIYSRIDFIAVSKALKPETEFKEAKILDDPEWQTASDHRAVLAIFK